MKSPDSAHRLGRELQDRAARVIPGGVNSATRFIGSPYAFARTQGQHVWDADGHRYLDYHAAFGAILLGHNDPGVNAAVSGVLGDIDLLGIGVTEPEITLAETLVDVIPSAEQAVLCTSGSEAVALAVRLARAATGRRYLVKVQGGFHGWHDPVARNVISAPENAYEWDPLSDGILPEALQATLIAEFNDLGSVAKLFDAVPGQVAAVIVEPIPHNVGALQAYPYAWDALRGLIGGIHLKDVARYQPGRHGDAARWRPLQDHRRGLFVTEPLGQGSLNCDALVRALRGWPDCSPVMLEPFCGGEFRRTWLDQSLAYVKALETHAPGS